MPEDPDELRGALEARARRWSARSSASGFGTPSVTTRRWPAALTIARRLHATGGRLLIAAEAGDDRRRGEAGHVDERRGLNDAQWHNLASGLHDLADRHRAAGHAGRLPQPRRHLRRDPGRDGPPAGRDRPGEGRLVPRHRSPRLRRRQQPRDAGPLRRPGGATSTSRTSTARSSTGRRPRAGASARRSRPTSSRRWARGSPRSRTSSTPCWTPATTAGSSSSRTPARATRHSSPVATASTSRTLLDARRARAG